MTIVTDDIDMSIDNYHKAPYLEYDLYLFSKGNIDIQTVMAPTLNIVPERGLRFTISIDDDKQQVIDILENNSH